MDSIWPWLRFSAEEVTLSHGGVVLDETAVRALVADLTAWLDRPKVSAPDA